MDNDIDFKLLTADAVVYTTKLDHMNIMKRNIGHNMSPRTILKCIERESKPKIQSLKRKRGPHFEMPEDSTLRMIEKKIKQFNSIIAKESEVSNANLLGLCRPVKVVLKDIKNSVLYEKYCSKKRVHKSQTDTRMVVKKVKLSKSELVDRFGDYLNTQNDSDVDNDDDIVYVGTKMYEPKISTPKQLKTINPSKPKFISIIDVPCETINIYYVNDFFFIKEYASLNTELEYMEYLSRVKEAKKLFHDSVLDISCCCWYGRETIIASIAHYPKSTIKFIKKRHYCDAYNCLCCCRKLGKSKVNSNSAEIVQDNYYKSTIDLSDILRQWFPKIFEYHRLIQYSCRNITPYLKPKLKIPTESKIYKNNKEKAFLKLTSMQIQNKYYEIGGTGRLKLFMNCVTDKFANINANICCWYSREKFIDRLLEFGALPDNIPFLRTTHQCPTGKCVCCCKPSKRGKAKLIFFSISQRHTIDCVKKKLNIKIKFPKLVKSVPNRNEGGVLPSMNQNEKVTASTYSHKLPQTVRSVPSTNDPTVTHVPGPATAQVLDILKNVRFIKTEETLLAELKVPLNHFNLVQLKVMDYILDSLEKLASGSLSQKKTDKNMLDNETENTDILKNTSLQTLTTSNPNKKNTKLLDLYTHLSILSASKTRLYTKSFKEFKKKHMNLIPTTSESDKFIDIDEADKGTAKISEKDKPSTSTATHVVESHSTTQVNGNNVNNGDLKGKAKIRIKTPMEICRSAMLGETI